jgi:predicted RNA polymerase sigma factor
MIVLYDALLQVTLSPTMELNRAVAIGMSQGPEVYVYPFLSFDTVSR